jgi:predicted cupin superfamily sugar epimerase
MTMTTMHPDAAALIERLGMRPHPEGGFYREVYRSAAHVQPVDGRPIRSALTTIYFLLPEGAHSRWHRVTSDEVWHLYEGGPLELYQTAPDVVTLDRIVLSPASALVSAASGLGVSAGPVHAVPAGWWQAARSAGPYALAGCTVGPGFDFADFSFLREAPDSLARLRRIDAALAELA